MTIVGFAESERKEASRGSGMTLIPPSLTLILVTKVSALMKRGFQAVPLLQCDVCIILCFRIETLRRLHALRRDAVLSAGIRIQKSAALVERQLPQRHQN